MRRIDINILDTDEILKLYNNHCSLLKYYRRKYIEFSDNLVVKRLFEEDIWQERQIVNDIHYVLKERGVKC